MHRIFERLIDAFRRNYKDAQGFDNPPVHDPCAVAYVIDPSVVETVAVPVSVELAGSLTRGRTVADLRAFGAATAAGAVIGAGVVTVVGVVTAGGVAIAAGAGGVAGQVARLGALAARHGAMSQK